MPNKNFSFEIISQNEKARLGKIKTPKGLLIRPVLCQ